MAPSQPRSKRNTAAEKAAKRRDQLSFSKRRNGLFNKVTELSILCQAETALIVTSKNNNGGDGGEIFVCGYPSPDAVIQRFLTGGNAQQEAAAEEKVEALRAEYEAVQERLKELQRKLQAMKEEQERRRGSVFPSWWETCIDDMDLVCLEQFKNSMENLRLNLIARQRYSEMTLLRPQMMMAPPPPLPQVMDALPLPPVVMDEPVQEVKYGDWVPCGHSVSPPPLPPLTNSPPQVMDEPVQEVKYGAWVPYGHRVTY